MYEEFLFAIFSFWRMEVLLQMILEDHKVIHKLDKNLK